MNKYKIASILIIIIYFLVFINLYYNKFRRKTYNY